MTPFNEEMCGILLPGKRPQTVNGKNAHETHEYHDSVLLWNLLLLVNVELVRTDTKKQTIIDHEPLMGAIQRAIPGLCFAQKFMHLTTPARLFMSVHEL